MKTKGCSFSLVYWLVRNEDPFLIDLLILQIDNCSEEEKTRVTRVVLETYSSFSFIFMINFTPEKNSCETCIHVVEKDEKRGKKNAISWQVIQDIPENTVEEQKNSLRLTRLDYISCMREMCIGKQHYIHVSNKEDWKLTVISFHQNCSIAFEIWERNWEWN